MPLLETKHGAADNMEDGEAAKEQVEEESRDDDNSKAICIHSCNNSSKDLRFARMSWPTDNRCK